MEFRELKIPCQKIDSANAAYRISSDQNIDALAASIAAIGLIQPPVVVPAADRYVIVSGHRRVAACLHLGLPRIPVRIPDPVPSAFDLVRLAVSENSSHRQLNPIELARSIALLEPFYATFDEMAAGMKDLLLPDNPEYLRKAALLATLSKNIQEYIIAGKIALPTALELIDLDKVSAQALADVFGTLQMSLNKQREVVKMAIEIAAIEETSVAEVVDGVSVKALLSNRDLDSPRKSQQLRMLLRQRRYPSIVEADRRFMDWVKNLPLGKYWRLTPPRYFESRAYEFKGIVGDLEELEKAKAQLEKLIRAPEMDKIFRIPRKLEDK